MFEIQEELIRDYVFKLLEENLKIKAEDGALRIELAGRYIGHAPLPPASPPEVSTDAKD